MICKNICHFFSTGGNPRSPSAPPFLGALVFHIFSNPHCPPPSLVQCPLPSLMARPLSHIQIDRQIYINKFCVPWVNFFKFSKSSIMETSITRFLFLRFQFFQVSKIKIFFCFFFKVQKVKCLPHL